MLKLAIVILNWNGERYLRQFLPTLLRNIPDYAEVIIADNASSDGSLAFLREEYPQIRVIVHPQNGGFSKGYNDAFQQIEAEYYCLLNSDIEVPEHWVEPVMELFESDDTIAAIQPKIISYHDRTKFEYAGASGGFIDKYGYPFCRGRVFDTLEEDHHQYDDAIPVFWATGAALFVRSAVYHQLGGLDEDFFAHMEEIDFCWRIKKAGYKLMIEPKSFVYHIGGGTLPKNNSHKTYLNFRNNLCLLLKNLPKNRLFITFAMRLVLDNVAAFSFLLKGNASDFTAVYKAHAAFLRMRKAMKGKRTGNEGVAFKDTWPASIVFLNYVGRKKHFDGHRFF